MKPTLRPEQIDRLAQYIANPRFLDLSDPGTGKTPPVCVYLYYQWTQLGNRTVFIQPKSLLGKNQRELVRFTEFTDEDCVILRRDWEPYKEGQPWKERVRSEQYAEEVILKDGTIVPFSEVDGTDTKFKFRWTYRITNAGKTDLPIGGHLTADVLSQIPKEKGVKATRLFLTRQVTEKVTDALTMAADAKVLLVTPNFLRDHWQELARWAGCVAIDEMHMGFGSTDSQNTNALYGLMRHATHFIGMTGTLLNGRLDSVYPAIHIIEPRYYVSYAGFRSEHVGFEDSFGRVLSWVNVEKVGHILLRHSVRRTFQDVYGDEPVVFLPDYVDMNPMMAEQYGLFHDQAMLELEDGTFLDGTMPGVATLRASQILAHPETMGLCRGEMTGKDERLVIHTTDAIERGESQLVFSVYTPEQDRIATLLEGMGRKVAIINGSVSGAKREKIDLAFQRREIDDVVGSPACMAVGYNWEHVDHVINTTYGYQDVDWLQSYRRASRGTRTKILRVTYMIYAGTVDERKLKIVEGKSRLANQVDPTRPVLKLAA